MKITGGIYGFIFLCIFSLSIGYLLNFTNMFEPTIICAILWGIFVSAKLDFSTYFSLAENQAKHEKFGINFCRQILHSYAKLGIFY